MYLTKYTANQLYCADPMSNHARRVRNRNLRIITFEEAEEFNSFHTDPSITKLASGMKICRSCKSLMSTQPIEDGGKPDEDGHIEAFLPANSTPSATAASKVIDALGSSPLQLRKRPLHQRTSYLETKKQKVRPILILIGLISSSNKYNINTPLLQPYQS